MQTRIYILRRLVTAALTVAAMLLAVSCIKDEPIDSNPDANGDCSLQITVEGSRAQADGKPYTPGDNAFNENAIRRVKLFFYNVNDSDDTPASYLWETTLESVYSRYEVTLRIDADKRALIFGNTGRGRVVAVVNLPAGTTIPSADSKTLPTINEIRSTTLTSDFRADMIMQDFVMLGDGIIQIDDDSKNIYGHVNLKRTAAKIRIAAIITEPIEETDPGGDPDVVVKTWTADTENLRAYITNGVSKARLDGKETPLGAQDYYKITPTSDFSTVARIMTETSGLTSYPYWNDAPFYSYPHSWDNSPKEEHQTYLTIQLPWQAQGELEWRTCYYQVPVNLRGGEVQDSLGNKWTVEGNTIESNMYYLVKLHIGMLGSFIPEEPTPIDATYEVVPWVEEDIDAELRDNRYLVLNQETWAMHNIEDLDIPFYTSHETVVARIKFRYWNFNPPGNTSNNSNNTSGTYIDDGETYTIDYDGKPLRRTITWMWNGSGNSVFNTSVARSQNSRDSIFTWNLDADNSIVSYHHDMYRWDEKTASGADVFGAATVESVAIKGFYGKYNGPTAYLTKTNMLNWSKIDVEITLIHKDILEGTAPSNLGTLDNTRFQQTIYITQYPPMYIEAERSNVYEDSADSYSKFVLVNGNSSSITLGNNAEVWKSVTDIFSGVGKTNQNVNMYVVNISQLNDDSYTIGDPRSLNVNNNLSGLDDISGDEDKSTWQENTRMTYYQSDEPYEWGARSVSTVNQKTGVPNDGTDVYTQGTRTLQNYYPTEESLSKENFVAPKLRIASSFGSIGGTTNKEMARRRCAAYQESGRPAGRWRLPTKAEIRYINELSSAGRIPRLFTQWGAQAISNGSPVWHTYNRTPYRNFPNYWCATGAVHIRYDNDNLEYLYESELNIRKAASENNRNGEGRNSAAQNGYSAQVAVRCVYDEWYWINEDGSPDLIPQGSWDKFYWGDKEKDNPQPTAAAANPVGNRKR